MSESYWRSRLLQTVGKGLLRLGTYFVRQAETPPSERGRLPGSQPPDAPPADAPPWLPLEFWQRFQQTGSRPPAHWLALLAESEIPIQWVGTSAPPAVVMGTAAGDAENEASAAPSIPPLWAAPNYAPGAPTPGRVAPHYALAPNAAARLMPTPTAGTSAAFAAPPYLPDALTAALPDPAYLPASRSSLSTLPAYPTATAPTLTDGVDNATDEAFLSLPVAAPDYAASAAAPLAAPPPRPIGVEDGRSEPPRARHPMPDYAASAVASPPTPGNYGQPSLPVAPPSAPFFAPTAGRLPPEVAYTPPAFSLEPVLAAQPAELPQPPVRQEAAPPRPDQRHTPLRYAVPLYTHSPYTARPDAAPAYVDGTRESAPLDEAPLASPPPGDRWPALPPLFTADTPAAAPHERQRQQRLEQEQRGERG